MEKLAGNREREQEHGETEESKELIEGAATN